MLLWQYLFPISENGRVKHYRALTPVFELLDYKGPVQAMEQASFKIIHHV